uniref:Right handed beta helix domain-containing protein n=1 Tax=Amphimedon queenslandica TaxID=400682 RepID=A0A1X7UEM8_AMPQE
MYFTILALSFALLSVSSGKEIINITSEYELEEFLCNETHSLDDDIVLVLSDSITHRISNNVSFCGVINDTHSLTLTSESSKPALIQCNDSSTPPNSGFAFTNIHSLTLTRLVFRGCGEQLKRLAAIESINSSASPIHANFTSILTEGTGICLYAVSNISDNFARNGNAQIILTDITAVRNTELGNLYTQNFDYILLNGNSTYTNNYGSVFGISNTKVILGGQLHFENNTGNSGSAFMLTGSSRFILKDGLNATFIHNVAFTAGGAIYAYNDITSECMFTPSTDGSNITMLFINNSATYSGNSIFSNNLYNCSTRKNFYPVVAKRYYHALSRGTIFNEIDDKQLSTVALKQVELFLQIIGMLLPIL